MAERGGFEPTIVGNHGELQGTDVAAKPSNCKGLRAEKLEISGLRQLTIQRRFGHSGGTRVLVFIAQKKAARGGLLFSVNCNYEIERRKPREWAYCFI